MLYAIVALLVIILDQWTKFWVAGHIALGTGSRDFIPGILKLVNFHNDGAALGFLSGKNAGMIFIILCAVFTIFVIVALATRLVKGPVGRWSLVFIMAGGISNCIDRLLNGYVQDMFLPAFWDSLPIFNVADVFITVFCLVFILFVLFGGRSDDDAGDEDDEEYLDDEDEDEDAEPDEEEEEDEDEEEEEFDDEEEEDDLPPSRRPSKYDRAARGGKAPSARRTERSDERDRKPSRRDRQAEIDEKYARYKAERAAREQQWAAAAQDLKAEQKPPVVDPADPFAEWDAANAAQGNAPIAPVQNVNAPAAPTPAAPADESAPAPVASKPAAGDDDMNFSLDDILAEFR